MFLAAQTTRQVSDFWVRWWVNDSKNVWKDPKKKASEPSSTQFYSLLYLLLVSLMKGIRLRRAQSGSSLVLESERSRALSPLTTALG